jgi:anaerobic magnesium-protoporphyrin IX monomethyl ester cyclase
VENSEIRGSSFMDVLFVNPNSSRQSYQGLAETYSAIEPPTWALLLAESCRSVGYGVGILDCDAERLGLAESINKIVDAKARLICFVVYGQNPNSGTTNMSGARAVADQFKKEYPNIKVCFVGSHVSAVPKEVLAWPCVDFILLNEGVYAVRNLLATDLESSLEKVKGIGWKRESGLILNSPSPVVPQQRMDIDLPGYAWDLLPYKNKPLDLYRAHFWHAEFDHKKRTPFAAIYTSLGCRFACDFCMINIVNRKSSEDDITAADSRLMRYWSPSFIFREMQKLAELGVETLRLSDEMFFLDKRFYRPLLESIVQEDFNFRMWAYSRIDTVRQDALDLFKEAGVEWLALGIEAGDREVRKDVSKGSFKDVNIQDVCKKIRAADINVISNYIFGFPHDTIETMGLTLDLALELNTEMANMYPCQALPGSPIYSVAKQRGWALPSTFEGYSFLSYECQPLPTETLSAAEVLSFRDNAWQTYFQNPSYLELVGSRFGAEQRSNVESMAAIKLKRSILGD